MIYSRRRLLATVSVAAAMTAGLAHAQESAASAVQDGPASTLDEVVVTAQRRSENVQKTPVAMDVVSASAIEDAGVTTLPSLSRMVPAIQIVQAAGATPIYFMRGVGSFTGNSLTDPAVSINYAGIPLARQYQGNGMFYDMERVEVLKGPQGTLYGRNTTGGAINLIPRGARLGEYTGDFGLSTGNYSALSTNGAVNIPLGDQAAIRAAFMTSRHDGYLNDGQQDEDGKSGRLSFLYEPSDTVTLRLGADMHHQGGIGGGYAFVDQPTFAGYAAGTSLIGAGDRVGYLSPRGQQYWAARGKGDPTDQVNPHFDNAFWGVNGQLDVETALGTLTVIPAYRHADLDYYAINSFELDVDERDEQSSLEVRFSSNADQRLRWIVGAFGLKDSLTNHGNFDNFNLTGSRQDFTAETKSWAAFADGTFDLTDSLRLIAGVRYTHDDKTANGLQTNLAGTGGFIPLDGDASFSSTNYRVGAQWAIAPSVMAYATVATGYHAGGFYFSNVVNPTDRNTYDPEKVVAYTIGEKGRFMDGRLQLNVEAFRWELEGQQISFLTFDGAGQLIFPTLNAGRSTNQGIEVDGRFQLGAGTTLSAQVQYLDLGSRGGLDLDLRSHYQSETVVAFNYLPADVQEGVWTFDASATYRPTEAAWSVGLFVNNLTDEAIKSNGTHSANLQGFQLRPPRTFGVKLDTSF